MSSTPPADLPEVHRSGALRSFCRSLRLKVIALFLALALVPLGLLTLMNYRTVRHSLQEAAHHSLRAAASETALTLNNFFEAKLTSVDTEAKLPILRKYLTSGDAEAADNVLRSLRSINRQDPIFIFSSALLDASGRNVIDTRGSYVGRDESTMIHFRKTVENGMVTLSPICFEPESGRAYLAVSAPILSREREIIGILRTFYDAHILQQLLVGSIALAGPGSFPIVLDENQMVLGYAGKTQRQALETLFAFAALPQEPMLTSLRAESRLPLHVRHLQDPFLKEAMVNTPLEEGSVAGVSTALHHQPWQVSFVIPSASFLEPLRKQESETVLMSSIIATLVIFLAFWTSKILFAPLRHLTRMAARVASGDLDAKVPVLSRDELGQLASSFNVMTRQLKERDQEREQLLIREQLARAEAEQANRLKDDFLATLSHELRTPLTAIVGWVNLLRDNPTPEELEEGLSIVERNAWAETQLVDDLLDVSRITRGKITLNRAALDLQLVVQEALNTILPSINAKKITLRSEMPQESLCTLGDWSRLRQIVLNLLANAVKFTQEEGEITLRLFAEGEEALITIRDNGIGIPPEHLSTIFTRFTQVDNTSTRRYGGMGLGLAIARHLVELHGGTINARSDGPGHGSLFSVRLPLLPLDHLLPEGGTQPSIPLVNLPPTPRPLDGLRVLVVEDDDDTLQMLRHVLSDAGADVATAQSAAEGVEAFERHQPDVVLSDIGLPREDGYLFLNRIRGRGKRGATVPAAALTAFVAPEDYERTRAAGFQVHLSKPIEPARLTAVVASLARQTPPAG